jgi:hypothetical protein
MTPSVIYELWPKGLSEGLYQDGNVNRQTDGKGFGFTLTCASTKAKVDLTAAFLSSTNVYNSDIGEYKTIKPQMYTFDYSYKLFQWKRLNSWIGAGAGFSYYIYERDVPTISEDGSMILEGKEYDRWFVYPTLEFNFYFTTYIALSLKGKAPLLTSYPSYNFSLGLVFDIGGM